MTEETTPTADTSALDQPELNLDTPSTEPTPTETPTQEPSDDISSLFQLSDDDLTDETPETSESQEPTEQQEEIPFDLADSGIPDHMHEGLGQLARDSGLKPDQASSFLKQAMAFAQAEEKKLIAHEAASLKQELGAEFEPTVKATRQFIARVAQKAGIPMEEMALLASPRGVRIMNAVRQMVSEPSTTAGHSTPPMSTEEQINAIMNDPDQFLALNDRNHPRHKEVNAKINKLYKIVP